MKIASAALRFGIPDHYIAYWRKTGLLSAEGPLDFQDLKRIQFLAQARRQGYSLQRTRAAILAGDANWLEDLSFRFGRIVHREGQQFVEAGTRQYVLTEPTVAPRVLPLAEALSGPAEELDEAYRSSLMVGDPAEQERLLDRILQKDARHTGALVEKGNLAYEKGQTALAESCYEKALQADPDCSEALYNLANLYFRSGKHAAAIRSFMRCMELDPDFPEPYYNLGMLYYSLRMFDRSILFLEMYCKMDPDSDWSARARNLIADVQSQLSSVEGLFHE